MIKNIKSILFVVCAVMVFTAQANRPDDKGKPGGLGPGLLLKQGLPLLPGRRLPAGRRSKSQGKRRGKQLKDGRLCRPLRGQCRELISGRLSLLMSVVECPAFMPFRHLPRLPGTICFLIASTIINGSPFIISIMANIISIRMSTSIPPSRSQRILPRYCSMGKIFIMTGADSTNRMIRGVILRSRRPLGSLSPSFPSMPGRSMWTDRYISVIKGSFMSR